ncbi:MAG TPA: amidase [Bryobacteraceae bacterium]|nr:amidase [Bryobacteraceae bacterium]
MLRRNLIPLIAAQAAFNRLQARSENPINLEQWLRATADSRKQALASCLRRIRRMDGDIRAWVEVNPQPQTVDGPLSGIPFGMKDVIETQNLATEYGSPIYKGRRGTGDAAIVRQLKGLGGILLGKTQTAAFAHTFPPPTRNPRNLAHTPGGSSSGSAAAVAAGMVPLAVGTQTGGSVIRPGSYCGITAFKPTYGLLSTEGVMPYASSLDTLGFFTHTPQDMILLWKALGQAAGRVGDVVIGAVEPVQAVEPPMAAAFRNALTALRNRGVDVKAVPVTAMLDRLVQESRLIMYYEGARAHEERYKQYGSRLQNVATVVEEGLQIPGQRYRDALSFLKECKQRMTDLYDRVPVILLPAATGPAPKGLTSTGDSRMNRAWTALGTPVITIPLPVGHQLPLGLQVTAAPGEDARVLHAAARLAALL